MAFLDTVIRWNSSSFDLNISLRARTSGFNSDPGVFNASPIGATINDINYSLKVPGYDFDSSIVTRYGNGRQSEIGINNPIYNNNDRIVNGSLNFYGDFTNGIFRCGIYDPDIGLAPLLRARATQSLTDDRQVLAHILDGDDYISLSRFSDIISSYGGNDLINSRAGNDTLSGGRDSDMLIAGTGADVVKGDAAIDILYGGLGNDRIFGGAAQDVISGEGGNDRLAGGQGADAFIFKGTTNFDVITDFGRGNDRMVLIGVDSFDDLTISFVKGGSSRIAFDGNVIIVQNVRPAEISDGDFIFGVTGNTFLNDINAAFFDIFDYVIP